VIGSLPASLAALREFVPEIVTAAVGEAAGHGPVPPGLRAALHQAVLHFLDPGNPPQTQVLALFQNLGTASAARGLRLGDVQAVQQAAVEAAAGLLAEHLKHAVVDAQDIGPLAQRALVLADRLKEAVAAGHTVRADHELVELLFTQGTDPAQLKAVAEQAGWAVPRTLAVVALTSASALAALYRPGDVLADPVRRCLIVPDPDGPGRPAVLAKTLTGLKSAIGPTVEPAQAAVSLKLARRTLDLVMSGAIADPSPVRAMRHAANLTIMNSPELARRLIDQQLAPLAGYPRAKKTVYLQTLHAWFECGSNIVAVAERLHVHPQTVRYRMSRIEVIFGPDLTDPARTLDYLIALRAWSLMRDLT
jgi:hypothetical protein